MAEVVAVKLTNDQRAFLDDLQDEIARGKVYECSLRSKSWQPDGLLDGESICVDPRPAILETVLHELIHRRKPRWTETRVSREARLLVVRMDEPTKVRWWKLYQRVKRKGPAVDIDE